MPCLSDNTINELIEGRVQGDRAHGLMTHLDVCRRCCEVVAQLKMAAARELGPGAPAEGTEGVASALLRRSDVGLTVLARDVLIGQTVGSYRIIRQLGSGGTSAVYLGEHALIDRQVAIKLLRPHLSQNDEAVQRFLKEARLAAQLCNPGIVQFIDCGIHSDGRAFMVMEHLEGETLAARLDRTGALPLALCVALAMQIASSLAAAHRQSVIHRDLSPRNIFLSEDSALACGLRVRILDFGVAKLALDSVRITAAATALTRPGAFLGTPRYMAPEQCLSAGRVDPRADIYSLGCLLFEMVCGRPPFEQTDIHALIEAHASHPPPAPSSLSPSVPRALDALILCALAKRPEDRPPTMEAVARALGRIRLLGEGGARFIARARRAWDRKWTVAAGVLALVLSLGGAGLIALTRGSARPQTGALARPTALPLASVPIPSATTVAPHAEPLAESWSVESIRTGASRRPRAEKTKMPSRPVRAQHTPPERVAPPSPPTPPPAKIVTVDRPPVRPPVPAPVGEGVLEPGE